ncbi:hypothetical protein Hdeb2414_s0005g00160611 [Helianthus debilis subsp. tardiflorus]
MLPSLSSSLSLHMSTINHHKQPPPTTPLSTSVIHRPTTYSPHPSASLITISHRTTSIIHRFTTPLVTTTYFPRFKDEKKGGDDGHHQICDGVETTT